MKIQREKCIVQIDREVIRPRMINSYEQSTSLWDLMRRARIFLKMLWTQSTSGKMKGSKFRRLKSKIKLSNVRKLGLRRSMISWRRPQTWSQSIFIVTRIQVIKNSLIFPWGCKSLTTRPNDIQAMTIIRNSKIHQIKDQILLKG